MSAVPRPVSAANGTRGKWHPATVVSGLVSITGGYNTQGMLAQSIEYRMTGSTQVFVLLDKNAHWFLKGVGGGSTGKGELKEVTVMELVRDEFNRKIQEGEDATAASAGSPAAAAAETQAVVAVGDDDDPMDQLDDLPTAAQAPRKPTPKKPDKDAVSNRRQVPQSIDVPTRPACAGLGQQEMTRICAYQSNVKGKFYIRSDCIDWLLAYAADELAYQGVEPSAPEPSAAAANCPDVPDLHLEWDFDAKAWEGTFVAGTLAGTRRVVGVKDINEGMWRMLRTESKVENCCFSKRKPKDIKNAAKSAAILWCAAVASGEERSFQDAIANSSESPAGKGAKCCSRGAKRRRSGDEGFMDLDMGGGSQDASGGGSQDASAEEPDGDAAAAGPPATAAEPETAAAAQESGLPEVAAAAD